MEITFVRHAESIANVTGHWQGQGDAPLSEGGRDQARRLGERLRDRELDLIVASDLSRASDTAAAIGRDLDTDPIWREVDVGAWEGLTRQEVLERFADQIEALKRGEEIAIGGGESWTDLLRRVEAGIARLRSRLGHRGRALVVTHGGVIHILVSKLMGLYARRPRPIGRVSNTAITTLRFEDDHVEMVTFNDTSHLGPVGAWTAERLEAGDAVVSLMEREAVAARLGVPLSLTLDGELADVMRRAEESHRGQRVGLLCSGEVVARYAADLFGHDATDRPRVAPPLPDAGTHLVLGPLGITFADYNTGV